MSVYIRPGELRNHFSIVYHDLIDEYHPYIGDKALLYYMFLLRYRHTKEGDMYGKSWNGRASVVSKFQMSFSTLPMLDKILQASGLIDIETKDVKRGREKIFYIVNDPPMNCGSEEWRQRIEQAMHQLIVDDPRVVDLLGKEKYPPATKKKIKSTLE